MDFGKAYMIGVNSAFFFGIQRLKREENFLLSLKDVLQIIKPSGKRYVGIKDIPVDKIIGTEDRSTDFATGFYPLRQEMEERWTTVKKLLRNDEISQAIQVTELDGFYFVSDGNHRVSVAKTNDIAFLTAEITSYRSPVKLYPAMTRKKLPLLKAKHDFYQESHVFDMLPEERFQVLCPSTWAKIQRLIFTLHLDWFVKKEERVPEDEELIRSWDEEIYAKTMDYIRLHSLSLLSPEKLDTDIFVDIMDFWGNFPLYDAWFPDVYELYVKKLRRKKWLLSAPHMLRNVLTSLSMTAEDARELFLQESRLLTFCPGAQLPTGDRRWYRFLTYQLLVEHFRYLREKFGREPYMHELSGDWYENHFKPAYDLYQEKQIQEPFQSFYIAWMSWWCKQASQKSSAIILPPGFTLAVNLKLSEKFMTDGTIKLPDGETLPAGHHLAGGTLLPKGTSFPQGLSMPKRMRLPRKNLFPIRYDSSYDITLEQSLEQYLQIRDGG